MPYLPVTAKKETAEKTSDTAEKHEKSFVSLQPHISKWW
jgi:hypothetical protein